MHFSESQLACLSPAARAQYEKYSSAMAAWENRSEMYKPLEQRLQEERERRFPPSLREQYEREQAKLDLRPAQYKLESPAEHYARMDALLKSSEYLLPR